MSAPTGPETSQVLFRHEYERELETWLRRRFALLCGTYLVLGVIKLGWWLVKLTALPSGASMPAAGGIVVVGLAALSLAIVAAFFLRRGRYETREDILGAAYWMILALGCVSLASRFAEEQLGVMHEVGVVVAVFFWHFTACLFLPWTPRDSLRPILPLLAVWALYTLSPLDATAPFALRLLKVMFSPGILVPGLLISGWRLQRHRRQFRSTMLGKHFRTLRQEFSRAREIHESLFPPEYDDGFVRFQYTYKPMRELGGDFLHLHVGPEGLIHLALLDVTGHGLAAALTVNRLFGELERIRGEAPRAQPGDVLSLLNRYVHLTMARHNIYATAIALTLDPYLGEVRWASAGHPPAFLRGANGVVRDLQPTTLVLGAVADEDFESTDERCELAPGDVIVPYTDGAFEARDRHGRQLGMDQLRDLLRRRPAPGNWPQFICASVEQHQVGRAEDDVLVAALTFAAVRPQRQRAGPALARHE